MTLTPVSTVRMPVLALRGLTVFPSMILHFDVGRDASIKALNQAHGRRQGAADKLGISKSSLWRKMKKYGISENY